mmetsp:Transcript_17477/g.30800  ORF Transcript_17477/g.30800 Transcript_17477/m.30800 type:complete len:373 (+) Transcript_17477:2-1120(+)
MNMMEVASTKKMDEIERSHLVDHCPEHALEMLHSFEVMLSDAEEKLSQCTEADFKLGIRKMCQNFAEILDDICSEIPRTDHEKSDAAMQYLKQSVETLEEQYYDADSTDHILQPQTPPVCPNNFSEQQIKDVTEGFKRAESLLGELAHMMRNVGDEHIEELATLSLSACHFMVKSTKAVFTSLRLELTGSSSLSSTLEHPSIRQSSLDCETDPPSSTKGSEKILWNPIAPKLQLLLHKVTTRAQKHPVPATAIAIVLAMIPFTWLIIFSLPPTLALDYVLQKGDASLAPSLAPVLRGTQETLHLCFVMSNFFLRNSRVLVGGLVNRCGGPKGVVCKGWSLCWYSILHPIDAAGQMVTHVKWVGSLILPPNCK